MKHLVIDSGATKADWKLIDGAECAATIHTSGINPLFQGGAELLEILSNEVLPKIGNDVSKISFYAAGIVGEEQKQSVASVFAKVFPDAAVEADSDLVAAARALFGNQPGIACIVGTGSNTCCWDGSRIVKNVRAGGFILGDEFSGAYLGKRILGDYIKGLVPRALENELQKRYGLSYETIVRNVYKSSAPGRYLASFAPFVKEFENHPYCKSLLESGFGEFVSRNLLAYDYRHNRIGFVGSIAYIFKDMIVRTLSRSGVRVGAVLQSPIDELVKYHIQNG